MTARWREKTDNKQDILPAIPCLILREKQTADSPCSSTVWESTNRAYAGMLAGSHMTVYLAGSHMTVLIIRIGAATY